MIYIYDILLNWCDINNLYDFYEWDLNDNIEHIKKITLIKVNKKTMDAFISNEIKIDYDLLESINSKCEIYDQNDIVFLKYAAIFTDGSRVLAIEFDKNGLSLFKSKMLIDEEIEVLDIASRLNDNVLFYQITRELDNNHYLTRVEKQIRNCLLHEFEKIYNDQDLQKLKYFYYEYFNNNDEFDFELMYHKLLDSLINLNNNHYKIYNIIKMLYANKSV